MPDIRKSESGFFMECFAMLLLGLAWLFCKFAYDVYRNSYYFKAIAYVLDRRAYSFGRLAYVFDRRAYDFGRRAYGFSRLAYSFGRFAIILKAFLFLMLAQQ